MKKQIAILFLLLSSLVSSAQSINYSGTATSRTGTRGLYAAMKGFIFVPGDTTDHSVPIGTEVLLANDTNKYIFVGSYWKKSSGSTSGGGSSYSFISPLSNIGGVVSIDLSGYATTSALTSGLASKQNTLGYTAESTANKTTDANGTSNSLYPTQGAVKSYVDASVANYYLATNPNNYISSVPAQSFASLTGKPITLSGYGITDAYPLSGNPSGFLISYTETDPTVSAWAKEATKPSYTKAEVGLGSVDNTSDANKPISTATQTALNLKLNSVDTLNKWLSKTTYLLDSNSLNLNTRLGGKLSSIDTAGIRFRPIAGTNVTLSGTYPNITIAAAAGGGAFYDSVKMATQYRLDTSSSGLRLSKQNNITLTTVGSSGASTLIGDVLNIPSYSGGSSTTAATVAEINTGVDNTEMATPLNLQTSKYLDQTGTKIAGTTAGISSAYTLMLSPAIAAYSTNAIYNVTFHATNTGGLGATLSINGLAAKPLVKYLSTALVAGDLIINTPYQLQDLGTKFLVKDLGFAGVNTSATLFATISDETGTGVLVGSTSPTFTGTPFAPTAAAATNTTQIATTAHVFAERANTATLTNKTLSGASNTFTNIPLATAVTGMLPTANGGTGLSAPGANGNTLISNGTIWVSTAPSGGGGGWGLTGSAITPGQFLGTTNTEPLILKFDSLQVAKFSSNSALALSEGAVSGVAGVAIGYNTNAQDNSVAAGREATSGTQGVSVGYGANSTGSSVSLGRASNSLGDENVSLGSRTRSDGAATSIAIGGYETSARASYAIAIAKFSQATHAGSFVMHDNQPEAYYISEVIGGWKTKFSGGYKLQVGTSTPLTAIEILPTTGYVKIAAGTYADEAAAVAAGLPTNTIYKTATGELRIKL